MRLACCVLIFGTGLFELQIGTPIDYSNVVSSDDDTYRRQARMWLGNVLAAHVRAAEGERPVAGLLLGLLDQPLDAPPVEGSLPNILLLNADIEQDSVRER
jgi:hypothetical protein